MGLIGYSKRYLSDADGRYTILQLCYIIRMFQMLFFNLLANTKHPDIYLARKAGNAYIICCNQQGFKGFGVVAVA